jgi:hypothetical protein
MGRVSMLMILKPRKGINLTHQQQGGGVQRYAGFIGSALRQKLDL